MSPLDLLDRPVRHDEAEPARVGRDPADDQVHPVGQAEAVAAGLDELAAADQVLQQPLEGGALFPRYLQALQQFPRRGGVVHLVADQLEQLFVIQHVSSYREWRFRRRWLDTVPGSRCRPPIQDFVSDCLAPCAENLQPDPVWLSLQTV